MRLVLLAAVLLASSCVIAQEHPVTSDMLRKLGLSGSFTQEQINNARDMLQACIPYTTDKKQLAYVLSTAIGESNLRPIKEYRGSEGSYLWNVQNKYWYTGYFGRGYVQLTWESNYRKFGSLLGVDLGGNPDLALRPDIAGKIICLGMYKGLFTGVGLPDYLSASNSDWTNARRIVNGLDKASEFGARASRIFNM